MSRRLGRDQPWGTMIVNLSGAAFLGALAGLLARGVVSSSGYALFGIGSAGSFTTFSTLIWETLALAEDRHVWSAVLNLSLTIVFGITFAYVAFVIASPFS